MFVQKVERVGSVMSGLRERLEVSFARTKPAEEPRYLCPWCRDTGLVVCYQEDGRNYPMKDADTVRVPRERRAKYGTCVETASACCECEEGTYRGRPTEGSLKAAERWVKENVTSTVSLKGTFEKAEEAGFTAAVVEQALKRQGVRKVKLKGRYVLEPV